MAFVFNADEETKRLRTEVTVSTSSVLEGSIEYEKGRFAGGGLEQTDILQMSECGKKNKKGFVMEWNHKD
ncbi:hypothetical protein E2C01_087264 [Portunus trituberculatus]|uniref:Uncharacterized protein n=1 Tax=Portunus trituberculatus TaxID=210409 RepID=A0A5B7J653_PORTR|nr:hypothetical protein [Portunus trituberculatus]